MLASEGQLIDVLQTVQSLEDRFNGEFRYPWVILNDVELSTDFVHKVRTLSRAHVRFGVIPAEHWDPPEEVDLEKAEEARKIMEFGHVGDGVTLRSQNIFRFFAGFFHQHPLLEPHEYAWIVEPGSEYMCSPYRDPFKIMEKGGKILGFATSRKDPNPKFASTLWKHVSDYITAYPDLLAKDNMLDFITTVKHKTRPQDYNHCSYTSSPSILSLDFLRTPPYSAFFDHLDRTGGFYYERWTAAAIHTLAVSLFADRDATHWFEGMGYKSSDGPMGRQYCPRDDYEWEAGKCSCMPTGMQESDSCVSMWVRAVQKW
ncbi:glycosyltransferase family 15 protein [Peniophora sp. CONT]|nr:glycosyltransferase family 15 protein [Peniophora sp. CONT]